jgi:catechol 2,3-dioxygenase-like lactoylglutathione lyase family enzyme
MNVAARYAHTNLIAHDWQRLARFYTEVFGCRPVGPQRDLGGEWLDTATGLTGARLQGQHLLLPGHEESGPT